MTPVADFQLLNSSMTIAISLFVLGAVGVMVRRNLAVICFSAAIMLQGVCLAFCSFASFHADWSGRTTGWIVLATGSLVGLMLAAVGTALVSRFRTLETSSTVEPATLQRVGDTTFESRVEQTAPAEAEVAAASTLTLTSGAPRDD